MTLARLIIRSLFYTTFACALISTPLLASDENQPTRYQAPSSAAFHGYPEDKLEQVIDLPYSVDIHLTDHYYRIGDPLQVEIKIGRTCRLNVLTINSQGQVTVLFPNQYQQDNWVGEGKTVTIPAHTAPVPYTVQGPAGIETIFGICRSDSRPVFTGAYRFQNHVYQPWGDINTVAADFSLPLRQASNTMAADSASFIILKKE